MFGALSNPKLRDPRPLSGMPATRDSKSPTCTILQIRMKQTNTVPGVFEIDRQRQSEIVRRGRESESESESENDRQSEREGEGV